MRSFMPILGKSPFGAIQTHMDKVYETAEVLPSFFDALFSGDNEKSDEIRRVILKMEHEADTIVGNGVRAGFLSLRSYTRHCPALVRSLVHYPSPWGGVVWPASGPGNRRVTASISAATWQSWAEAESAKTAILETFACKSL